MLLYFSLIKVFFFINALTFIRFYENFVICSCGAILASLKRHYAALSFAPDGASFDFVVIYSFGMSLASSKRYFAALSFAPAERYLLLRSVIGLLKIKSAPQKTLFIAF